MKLKVQVGPHRSDMVIANVNRPDKPTEIDTDLFAGRVVVYVKDFQGVTPDGSEPTKEHPYFHGRSRKFAIVIEGRFKQRPGVEPYTGEEIQFGSDFDYLPESFPRTPFNAGMRVAQYIDPATHYQEKPPSGRPYIMSPYLACMTTFCAYPAPEALNRALVIAHHDSKHPHVDRDSERQTESFVPFETMDDTNASKPNRSEASYWRFLGLKGQPHVDEFIETHKHLMTGEDTVHLNEATTSTNRPGLTSRTTLELGTRPKKANSIHASGHATPVNHADMHQEGLDPSIAFFGAPIRKSSGDDYNTVSRPGTPSKGQSTGAGSTPKKKASGRFSLASLKGALPGVTGAGSNENAMHEGDLTTADQLQPVMAGTCAQRGNPALLKLLGPWRFADPAVDVIEDSTFIFLDPTHEHSVAQRRKHFVAEQGRHRKEFVYSPDIVYTASFFTPFADLNTFDLKLGPVNMNVSRWFADMPIRYTLRSTRLTAGRDGGPDEEETFATISFQLVDE
ncbi:hypothetical protein OIO90_003391 [Microbotryomycetes sp. JL221]|nr:hypothetical protein OIO90_003391 [Microbotryomycetes sp. JL221]